MQQINNGFKPCYYIDDDGTVSNADTGRMLKRASSYNLTAVDGTRRKIGAWELYALVFGADAFIRLIPSVEGETFKVLPLNRKFAVSNYGRVFSTCEAKLRKLKPQLNYEGGYYRVSIKPTGGKQKYYLIHELVGELFLEKPRDKEGGVKDDLVVHHKNFKHGINDNTSENLVWLTKAEHAQIHKREEKIE